MISEHISYNEVVRSNTAFRLGISNKPNEKQLTNIKLLAKKVFEPLRIHFGVPIRINSFFRSTALNIKVGGSKKSQHTAIKGAAMDLDDTYGKVTNKEMFNFIKDNLEFDQLIWEYGNDNNPNWVHVSFNKENNRGRILIAYKNSKGKNKYKNW